MPLQRTPAGKETEGLIDSSSAPVPIDPPTMEMEAPLHQFPVPPLALPQDASLLQQAVAAGALMMAGTKAPAPAAGPGREQCPRCASRDTKFCYYNNYNTAQPRHFCRACRRYWTLGGSLRNVPVGGSTRKRARPARPTRAIAAAAAKLTASGIIPFASPGIMDRGVILSSLLLGTAPLLEGRLGVGFDLGLGQAAVAGADGAAGDCLAHHQLLHQLGAGPLPWPAGTILEGDRAETTTAWKAAGVLPFPPAAALWQDLAAAAPVDAGGLHHGASHLLPVTRT